MLLDSILRFLAMPKLKQALLWSFGLMKTLYKPLRGFRGVCFAEKYNKSSSQNYSKLGLFGGNKLSKFCTVLYQILFNLTLSSLVATRPIKLVCWRSLLQDFCLEEALKN